MKDLHIEDITSWPHQFKTWFTTPATLGTFCLCTVMVQVISHHNQCSESCNLGYSLVVYPKYTRQTKHFHVFYFFTLETCVFSDLSPLFS